MTQRAKQQYEHFKSKLENIIHGHRDQELEDSVIRFIREIEFSDLTQSEREIIFSKTMC